MGNRTNVRARFAIPAILGENPVPSLDTFKARRKLNVGLKTYTYFSLKAAEKNGLAGISRLPNSLKILLENLLRYEDGRTVTADDIRAVAGWLKSRTAAAFR